jgi:hypothetical protein
VNNLAGKPEHSKTIEELRNRLTEYLKKTADPRFSGGPVKFDEYIYRTGYMKKRLEKFRNK